MTFSEPRGYWGLDLQPLNLPLTAPEPVMPAIRNGIEAGATRAELAADTPIFQTLIREVVQQQVKYEEDQLREWLRALIENPAGRKIIEEMLDD